MLRITGSPDIIALLPEQFNQDSDVLRLVINDQDPGADADTDGDGVSNVDEVDIYGTDPTVANVFNDSNDSGGGGCFIGTL